MDALVDSQIIRSLTQIFKSTPLNKCIKCHKCINENFVFTINNNKIQSSMRCSNTDSIVNFEINDLYTNENNNSQILEILENKSIFTSTRELFTFVQDKITNNIFLKNEMINRINKTHYINKRDKENMIAKLMDSFTNNMKINIDCYKILHFLLYNDIQLKEKEELEQEHEQQQNLFMDQKKELEKEINKKKAIVNALIPLEYQNIIFSLSQYNEEKDEWLMPKFEEMKTNSRKNPQLAMGYDDEDNCKLFILFIF